MGIGLSIHIQLIVQIHHKRVLDLKLDELYLVYIRLLIQIKIVHFQRLTNVRIKILSIELYWALIQIQTIVHQQYVRMEGRVSIK